MDRRALVDKLKPSEGTLRQRGITTLYILDRAPLEVVVECEVTQRVDLTAIEDMLSARVGEVLRLSRRDELRSGTSLVEAIRVF